MLARKVITPVVGLLFSIAVAHCNTGCKPAQAADGAYQAELLNCVNKAKTLEESKACRKDVDKKFGVSTVRGGN